jgi:methyl-galactoside transport system substrate-binding protein
VKKLLFVVLALAMVFSVATVALAADKPTVGVLIYKYDDTYISTVRKAIEKYSADVLDITMQDGKGDQATQNDQLDVFIQKGVDVLVVNMVDAAAAQGVVDKAKAADIPVVFFNREPSADVIKSYEKAIFVGTNAADAGVMQGELIASIWGDGAVYDLNKDGIVQYLMFQGEPDNPEAIARTEFSVKEAEAKGLKMELANGEILVCNWDAALAQTAMEAILNSGTNVEFVICNNDGMAQGAIAALIADGKNTGEAGADFIPVVGVDATDAAIDLISKGQMSATVKQDGDAMGKAIVEVAANIAAGKDPLDGTDYKYDDSGVAIRIPYAPYDGKTE